MLRTKEQSLTRLRSLTREQLHKLSEGFTIQEAKSDPNKIGIASMIVAAIYTLVVILITN